MSAATETKEEKPVDDETRDTTPAELADDVAKLDVKSGTAEPAPSDAGNFVLLCFVVFCFVLHFFFVSVFFFFLSLLVVVLFCRFNSHLIVARATWCCCLRCAVRRMQRKKKRGRWI